MSTYQKFRKSQKIVSNSETTKTVSDISWEQVLERAQPFRKLPQMLKFHGQERETDNANTVTTRFLWRATSDIWADVISALSFLRLALVVARLLCTVLLSLCTLAVSLFCHTELPPIHRSLSYVHRRSDETSAKNFLSRFTNCFRCLFTAIFYSVCSTQYVWYFSGMTRETQ